jgi:integrase/recombinase XerD
MKKLKLQKTNNYSTIKQAFAEYQKYNKLRNLAEQTLIHKEEQIKKFFKFIDDDNFLIKDVDKKVIEQFTFSLLEEDIKAVTANTYLRNLRAFINWCSNNNYLQPIKFTMLKVDDEIKETYSESQLRILLEKPDIKKCSFVEYRSWVLINYLISTGNRLNTIINIKISDIDFDNEMISLKQVKNRKQQIIPLSHNVIGILKEYLSYRKGNPDDYLFVNIYGEQLTSGAVEKSIAKYNTERNVNITSIHAFRHSFGKMFILNGGDVFRLQKLMSHKDISTTRIYVNLYGEDLKEGYEKYNPLDVMLSKNNKQKINMKK